MKTTPKKTFAHDLATYGFRTHEAAVKFKWDLLDAGIKAGLPTRGIVRTKEGLFYTIGVEISSWMERGAADKLAESAPCVEYKFASQRTQ